jgi:glycosyltransferase involved in cell wall biosynthesis
MNRADCILLDSNYHIQVWSERYHVPISKFERVFLASDDEVIRPSEKENRDGAFLVHFHGEYAPFHGVSVILKAAHLLRDENVQFQIIGFGTTYDSDMVLAQSLNLTNCRFIRWVPYEELGQMMSRADVCLGFFGDRPRAYEVFTNKVVEATAVAKPLVTMRNKPVAEYLTDGESVIFVEPGDPQSLADAIRRLKDDPNLRGRIGRGGYTAFQTHCTLDAFSKRMEEIIQKVGSGQLAGDLKT